MFLRFFKILAITYIFITAILITSKSKLNKPEINKALLEVNKALPKD